MPNINKLILQAEGYFKIKKFDLAEIILNRILIDHPQNTNANELLAYIKSQQGDHDKAHYFLLIACSDPKCSKEALYYLGKSYLNHKNYIEAINNFKLSLSKGLKIFECYNDLGIAFAYNNNHDEALINFNNAFRINKNSYTLLYNIAKCYENKGEYDNSIQYCNYALKINPKFIEAKILLGISFSKKNQYKEAIFCFEEILSDYPNYTKAWTEIGLTLIETHQFESAILNFERAIELDSFDTAPLFAKGIALQKLNKHDEAIIQFDNALKLNNLYTDALINKGVSLNAISNFNEAINCFELAIKTDEKNDLAWSNLGVTYNCLKTYEKAFDCFTKAIKINFNNNEAHYGLSYTLFQKNCFNNAWNEFEFRWLTPKMSNQNFFTNKPKWSGKFNDQKLYLWPEQGLGEHILFSSVFNELQNSSINLLASTNKKLLTIFKRSFPRIKIIENTNIDCLEFDEYISFGSAVRYFRQNKGDFSKSIFPYLRVNPDNVSKFKNAFTIANKLTIGVSWESYNKDIGSYKSIPNFYLEELISDKYNFNWINLHNKTNKYFNNVFNFNIPNLRNINEFDTFDDIDSLISLIDTCDLIITCSNTTAHLAGSLYKQTLLLLPYGNGRLWYWQNNGSRSLWYPSVILVNQENPFDWVNPIIKIKNFLNNI